MSIVLLRMPAPSLNGMLGTASIYALVIVLLVARFALARRPVSAVVTVSVGVFVLSMVDVVLLPRALPAMVFLPVLAIAMALPYISGRALLGLSIAATLTIAVSANLSEFVHLFAPTPGLLSQIIFILAVTFLCGLTLLLLWQYQRRQAETLEQVRTTNSALQTVRASLETEVVARTADLRAALGEVELRASEQAQLLDEIAQQRMIIRDLSVPVLPVSSSTLVMPLVGALDSARLQLVQEQALRSIDRSHGRPAPGAGYYGGAIGGQPGGAGVTGGDTGSPAIRHRSGVGRRALRSRADNRWARIVAPWAARLRRSPDRCGAAVRSPQLSGRHGARSLTLDSMR
jgi:hypothetical protein